MEKFNLKKSEKELKKTASDTDTNADATIFLILNNMMLYNDLIDDYIAGDKTKAYFMYQLNSSIFKQLAAFQQVPERKKKVEESEESKLFSIMEKVNRH